jgi:small subunit ribosomal protein S1
MSTENGPEPTETQPEPKPAEAQAETAPAEEHDEGEAEAEGEGEGAEVEGGAPGEPGKKKRRRRRKKKGDAPVQLGPDGQPLPAPPPAEPKPRRDLSALPFSRFFPEGGGRRHILAPGEAVAGRVLRVEHGVAVIDLFGRGIAFATENEPRELPAPAPEEQEPEAASPAADPNAVAGAMAQLDGQVGMPASESLPPPPPMEGGAGPEVPEVDQDGEPAAPDPYAIAQAATGLLRVGTPQLDSDGDGIPDELDPTPHGEAGGGTETSAGGEEAPALDAAPEAPPIEVGSVFRGRIAAVAENGSLALYNRTFVRTESRARLSEAMKARRRVFGIVFGYNRGGFDVLVEGLRAFCPVSGLALEHLEDPEPLLGRRLEFSVQQAKSGHQGVVVSRRGILEREARKRARELRKGLSVGQKLKGRVTAVRDFGLIVDLGGIEGLVHMSEVSWDRSVRPADAAKVGDEVEVKIVRLGAHEPRPGQRPEGPAGGRDKRRDGRIGLSIKACLPDPFESELKELPEGSIKKGKVTRVAEFGAFVEIAPGVEGLLHVSELGKDLRHAGEKIKEGEEVYVCIDRIDVKARRVALSKLSEQDAKLFEEGTLTQSSGGKAVRPGATLKVRVEKVESGGIIVQIEGVIGKRGRGFLPNAETGYEKGTDQRKKFPTGMELEVKIIGLDRDGGWKVSKKALANDEERKAIQDYRREASAKGFGTFGDLLKRKLKI